MYEDRTWLKRKKGELGPEQELAPPCQQCFPGLHKANVDAWEVFRLAATNPWGVSAGDVISIIDALDISDRSDCLTRVMGLVQDIESARKEPRVQVNHRRRHR